MDNRSLVEELHAIISMMTACDKMLTDWYLRAAAADNSESTDIFSLASVRSAINFKIAALQSHYNRARKAADEAGELTGTLSGQEPSDGMR